MNSRVSTAKKVHVSAATANINGSAKSWLARARASWSLVLLVPVGVLAAFSPLPSPEGSWTALFLSCASVLIFLTGAAFRWWATLYIGARKGQELIVEGPYSVCRNPLYFGTFLITVSFAIMLESSAFIIAALTVSALYLMLTVPEEERRLLEKHGDAFIAYTRRVPRLIPRFDLYQSSDTIEVKHRGLHAEFVRFARWATIPCLCQLLLHLRAQPWWPHWFHVL